MKIPSPRPLDDRGVLRRAKYRKICILVKAPQCFFLIFYRDIAKAAQKIHFRRPVPVYSRCSFGECVGCGPALGNPCLHADSVGRAGCRACGMDCPDAPFDRFALRVHALEGPHFRKVGLWRGGARHGVVLAHAEEPCPFEFSWSGGGAHRRVCLRIDPGVAVQQFGVFPGGAGGVAACRLFAGAFLHLVAAYFVPFRGGRAADWLVGTFLAFLAEAALFFAVEPEVVSLVATAAFARCVERLEFREERLLL